MTGWSRLGTGARKACGGSWVKGALVGAMLGALTGCPGGRNGGHETVPAPTDLTYSEAAASYTKGVPIVPNTPSSSGGAVTSYSVAPALPAGLSLDPTSGVISGTPSAAAAVASYVVTASNAGGHSDATLSIVVHEPAPVAADDLAVSHDGAAVSVDVLANDSDPSSLALVLASVSQPSSGTASIVAGKVYYQPDAAFIGTVTIQYVVSNGDTTAQGTLTIECRRTLMLTGVVYDGPIANATVTADAGAGAASALADASGVYEVTVDVLDPSTAITVTGAGDPSLDQGHVLLATILGSYRKLEPLVSSGTLSSTDDPNLNVTNVSTARYGLLTQANGGAVPTTDDEVAQAEKAVSAEKLLDVAAAIKVSVDSASTYPLQAGTSTLDLATDPASLSTYVDDVTATAGSTAPLDTAKADTLADPVLTPAAVPPTTTTMYYFIWAARPGFLSRGGDQFTLNPDGTGLYVTTDQVHALTWTMSGSATDLALATPVTSGYWSDIRDSPMSASVQQEYLSTFGSYYIWVDQSISAFHIQVVSSGELVDWVQVSPTGTLTYQTFTVTSGTYSLTSSVTPYTAEVRDSTRVPPHPFTADMVTGAWAFDVYYSAQAPNGSSTSAKFNGDLVTFGADGGGSSKITGRTLAWSIAANGDLDIAWSDGTTELVRIVDTQSKLFAAYCEHRDGGGNLVAATYDYAFAQDQTGGFTLSNVRTGAGSYWQTLVNAWIPDMWVNDQLVDEQLFGWQFLDGGTGYVISDGNLDGQVTPTDPSDFVAIHWAVQSGEVTYNQPGVSDPDKRIRTWTLVSFDGTRMYLLEQALVRQTPDSTYDLYFEPRLNVYDLWSNTYGSP